MPELNRAKHVAEAFPNATSLQGKYAIDAGEGYDDNTFALAIGQLAAAYTVLDIPALRVTLANLARPAPSCARERAMAESAALAEERAARLSRAEEVDTSLADMDPDVELATYFACKAAGKVNPMAEQMVEVKGRRPRDIWSVAQAMADYLAASGGTPPPALRTAPPASRPSASAGPTPGPVTPLAASIVYAPEALPWE